MRRASVWVLRWLGFYRNSKRLELRYQNELLLNPGPKRPVATGPALPFGVVVEQAQDALPLDVSHDLVYAVFRRNPQAHAHMVARRRAFGWPTKNSIARREACRNAMAQALSHFKPGRRWLTQQPCVLVGHLLRVNCPTLIVALIITSAH